MDYTCPHCGKALEIPDEYAGEAGICIFCKKEIVAPVPDFRSLMGDIDTRKATHRMSAEAEEAKRLLMVGMPVGTGAGGASRTFSASFGCLMVVVVVLLLAVAGGYMVYLRKLKNEVQQSRSDPFPESRGTGEAPLATGQPLSSVPRLDIGGAYTVSRATPMHSSFLGTPLGDTEGPKQLEAGGLFRVLNMRPKSGVPWYQVVAGGAYAQTTLWIEGTSLVGQELERPATPSAPEANGASSGGAGSPTHTVHGEGDFVVEGTETAYHRKDCRTLQRSKNLFAISLADATAKGYSPCPVCTPGNGPSTPAP